jgi:type IV pilus assembly protein PilB
MKKEKKIGELLIEAGLIDELQLNSALSYQSEWGGRLGSIIFKKGFASKKDIVSALEKQFESPSISLEDIEAPPQEVLDIVSLDTAKKFGIFPVGFEGKTIVIAAADPTDLKTLDDIGFRLGVRVKPVLALESDIRKAIEIYYEGKVLDEETPREVIGPTILKFGERVLDKESLETPPEIERIEKQSAKPKPDVTLKTVMENVIELLVEKGVFTREELIRKIKSRNHS